MAFGPNFNITTFSDVEEMAQSHFALTRQSVEAALQDLRLQLSGTDLGARLGWSAPAPVAAPQPVQEQPGGDGAVFDTGFIRNVLDSSGLGGLFALGGVPEVRDLNDLGGLAARLPGSLGGPDSTGEVRTGDSNYMRETLAVDASLTAVARIVAALGPDAVQVEVRGKVFTIAERYEDPVSGFSAVRLTPADGSSEVFTIDGLQVGSQADAVAAVTLGRLQVESDAFREMIADAAAFGGDYTRGALFVGPSLGGAVAQVAAYETAEALVATGRTYAPGQIDLVTVDPLGGADVALATNGGVLDRAALNLINGLNVRTEGDLISRIGSHIGETWTLPGRDAAGNVVQLNPAEAHVNIVSLLQNLTRDDFFGTGVRGAPEEISGFAAVLNAAADQVVEAYLASQPTGNEPDRPLQIGGTARLDATRTLWTLDADDNGTVDFAVRLSQPLDPGRDDLVLV